MKQILMSTTMSKINENDSAIVIAITGDTFSVKETLKGLGYKYDDREWFTELIPSDYSTKEVAALEAAISDTKVIFDSKRITGELMKFYK